MFVAGISIYAALIFSFLSFLVAVPSAIKVFNWTATLYKGSISFEAPMLFALGFVVPVHGRRADRPVPGHAGHGHARPRHLLRHRPFPFHHGRRHGDGLHGRAALLVAEDHRPDVLGVVVAAGGDHHLRRLLPDVPAAVRRSATPACRGATTRYAAGVPGLERACRRPARRSWRSATCCRCAICCCSLRHGKPAGPNPWRATGLEWQTPSPPPQDNFEETPVVVRGPYEYHLEKAQNEP